MIRIVLSLFILTSLAACDPDRRKNASEGDLRFATTDDAELYFKNLRRRYYDHEDIPAAKLDVYRLAERNQNVGHPVLNLAIAHNWRHDEAYLLLEPNEAVGAAPPLHIHWQSAKDSTQQGDHVWNERNKLAQLEFATKLNNSLKRNHILSIVTTDSAKVPLLATPTERETFKRTMFDYYKLTSALK